jgi:hypothetical protein
LRGRPAAIGIGALATLGWLYILAVHDWELAAPAVFLSIGWLAVLLVIAFLWNAAVSAAAEVDRDGAEEGCGDFDHGEDRRGELEREKKALLKSIKEVEFDREMGKMSATDADEIVQFYRNRAIEILKEIDRIDQGKEGSVAEVIEREVRARLAVSGTREKGKNVARSRQQAKKNAEAPAQGEPGDQGDKEQAS